MGPKRKAAARKKQAKAETEAETITEKDTLELLKEDDQIKDEPMDDSEAWKSNPWTVTNLNEFLHYNCPECDYKSKESRGFITHALAIHPNVSQSFHLFVISKIFVSFLLYQHF